MLKIINIVHVDIHYDDNREITAVDIKLKAMEGTRLNSHEFTATVSAAFFKTTLLTDVGAALQIKPSANRCNIINLYICLKEQNKLALHDVANFVDAFQKAVDDTHLF